MTLSASLDVETGASDTSPMTAHVVRLRLSVDPLMAEARRRMRQRRVLVAALAMPVAAGTAGAVLALRPPNGSGGPSSGVARVVRKDGITARLPVGWFVTNEPLNGIADPAQRLVLSSYRVPARADASGYYTPPASGVLAQVDEAFAEFGTRSGWPRRPSRFSLGRLSGMEGFGGHRWTEFLFRQHGRDFYIFVWIGKSAPERQTRLLLNALDSLRIAPSH